MLHVATTMTSQDVVLWFIFKLQADVRSVLQAVAVVNYCFELLLCKLVLFFLFHETWQTCMQSFIHRLMIDSF